MLKIAVVDDEIVFVESLINKITAVCEKLNFEFKIDKYSNGFDILENYSKYHLIFLDIEMPSIDGIATAKRINKLKSSAEIPFIVYVTSHDELVFDALKSFATVYKGNIIKNLIMDCQSYTKYRPNETTGGIFVSWRRKEELPTGA